MEGLGFVLYQGVMVGFRSRTHALVLGFISNRGVQEAANQ